MEMDESRSVEAEMETEVHFFEKHLLPESERDFPEVQVARLKERGEFLIELDPGDRSKVVLTGGGLRFSVGFREFIGQVAGLLGQFSEQLPKANKQQKVRP